MAILVQLSIVRAAELADDPAGEGGISVLSTSADLATPMMDSAQFLFSQSLVNGIARDKHYILYVYLYDDFWSCELYYFDELEYHGGVGVDDVIDQLDYQNIAKMDTFSASSRSWTYSNGIKVTYNSEGKGDYYFGNFLRYDQQPSGKLYGPWKGIYCFSDVGPFPDIRTQQGGGGVDYAQVACVILCSFGLYHLFAGLWSSIRGRVD